MKAWHECPETFCFTKGDPDHVRKGHAFLLENLKKNSDLILYYEDLVSHPRDNLKQLFDFCCPEIDIDDNIFDEAVRRCSKSELKKRELKQRELTPEISVGNGTFEVVNV
jgi:hypothetical protein